MKEAESALRSLAALARNRKTWSPLLLSGVLWRALSDIRGYGKILEVLKFQEFAELNHEYPRFAFKYLTHDYLARGLTVASRASCFRHHYMWLRNTLPCGFMSKILHNAIPLVTICDGTQVYGINLRFSGIADKEGELSLDFQAGGDTLFMLSFSVVPGAVLKSDATDVLLISRIQGVKGRVHQISLAYRSTHGAGPSALLLTALQAFGSALGIATLACVSGVDQSAFRSEYTAPFLATYDNFLSIRGITKNAANVFLSPIPIPEKPIHLFKRSLRTRTLMRRQLKSAVNKAVRRLVNELRDGNETTTPEVWLRSELVVV